MSCKLHLNCELISHDMPVIRVGQKNDVSLSFNVTSYEENTS